MTVKDMIECIRGRRLITNYITNMNYKVFRLITNYKEILGHNLCQCMTLQSCKDVLKVGSVNVRVYVCVCVCVYKRCSYLKKYKRWVFSWIVLNCIGMSICLYMYLCMYRLRLWVSYFFLCFFVSLFLCLP